MKERILYKELSDLNKQLANEFDDIYKEALNIWDEQYLRTFTIHGKEHTEQVAKNLDALTRPLRASGNPLSAAEIFVLLSACCLHDIGMQLADDPTARPRHPQHAYKLILYSHARVSPELRRVTLPITETGAREAIAAIARGHWTKYARKLKREEVLNDRNDSGRLRLLGALLAMADLLDTSPVRARYYRSIHRLYDLPPLSELHQRMQDTVKWNRIVPPNIDLSGDLQFQLEWRDDSQTTRDMSDWLMKWFDSQWHQLAPILHIESGGVIRWAKPWATVTFNRPIGPQGTLSAQAINVLAADRAEQERINRARFIKSFRDSLKKHEVRLFLFPKDSLMDGNFLSKWCEAQSKLEESCKVARVNIERRGHLDFHAIVAQLMAQWDEPIVRGRGGPLQHLQSFILANKTRSFVTILISEEYREGQLRPLIEALSMRSAGADVARICILLTREAVGPTRLDNVSITAFDGTVFSRENIERHLLKRWGLNPDESIDIYNKLSANGLLNHPAQVYKYIATHCSSYSITD